MHALLLAAFAVLYIGEELDAPLIPDLPLGAVSFVIGAIVVVVGGVWLLSAFQGRGLSRDGKMNRIRRVERWAATARWALLAVHAAAVILFGLLTEVRDQLGNLIAIDETISLLPLVFGLMVVEFAIYPIERRLRNAMMMRSLDEGLPVHPFPNRLRFVWLWTRHHILFILIPLSILLAWSELAPLLVPEGGLSPTAREGWFVGIQILGVAAVFTLIPPLLVRIWDTVPLPPGRLRNRLDDMCATHRVRIRNFLVWRTGGVMLNGAAIGLVHPLRYVVLSDALLTSLTEREVEAVAAHEIGHIRCKHTLWLAISILAAIMILGTLAGMTINTYQLHASVPLTPPAERIAVGVVLAFTLIGTLVVLGMVSRRFERQADAFALRHLSGEQDKAHPVETTAEAAHAMAGALQRVADAHAIDVRRKTFRHGSIYGRQRALITAVGQRTSALAADRVAKRTRLVVVGMLAIGVGLVVWDVVVNAG